MRYSYTQDPLADDVEIVNSSPMVYVRLGRTDRVTPEFEAIVDSGSSICIFHSDVAQSLGIGDITKGEHFKAGGIAQGSTIDMYGYKVDLIYENEVSKITAYFSDQLPNAGILGLSGFFDRHRITFDPEGFEITPYQLKAG